MGSVISNSWASVSVLESEITQSMMPKDWPHAGALVTRMQKSKYTPMAINTLCRALFMEHLEDRLWSAWKIFDLDGSGAIPREDWEKLLELLGEVLPADVLCTATPEDKSKFKYGDFVTLIRGMAPRRGASVSRKVNRRPRSPRSSCSNEGTTSEPGTPGGDLSWSNWSGLAHSLQSVPGLNSTDDSDTMQLPSPLCFSDPPSPSRDSCKMWTHQEMEAMYAGFDAAIRERDEELSCAREQISMLVELGSDWERGGAQGIADKMQNLRDQKNDAEEQGRASEEMVGAVEAQAERAKIMMQEQLAELEQEVRRTLIAKDSEVIESKMQLKDTEHELNVLRLQVLNKAGVGAQETCFQQLESLGAENRELRMQLHNAVNPLPLTRTASANARLVRRRSLPPSKDALTYSLDNSGTLSWSVTQGSVTMGSASLDDASESWDKLKASLTPWQRVQVEAHLARQALTMTMTAGRRLSRCTLSMPDDDEASELDSPSSLTFSSTASEQPGLRAFAMGEDAALGVAQDDTELQALQAQLVAMSQQIGELGAAHALINHENDQLRKEVQAGQKMLLEITPITASTPKTREDLVQQVLQLNAELQDAQQRMLTYKHKLRNAERSSPSRAAVQDTPESVVLRSLAFVESLEIEGVGINQLLEASFLKRRDAKVVLMLLGQGQRLSHRCMQEVMGFVQKKTLLSPREESLQDRCSNLLAREVKTMSTSPAKLASLASCLLQPETQPTATLRLQLCTRMLHDFATIMAAREWTVHIRTGVETCLTEFLEEVFVDAQSTSGLVKQ
eukprot:TRINITY_DN6344_c0_g1_i1.p1 TRINITY_DN6344_c0_g1~~TRINITY_DN6344_c0_g1_i1.p1  ORF type:complete len:792 (-),score=159.16 TRINITY_DN6344_c0_g1_i1:195-2570(-)